MDRYYIAMDPKGSIAYEGPCIDTRGRGPHGVIHVLTENVADSYLHYLREKGISYIFCGKEKLDPVTMMEKAHSLFGLQKVILSGGAYTDWTLLPGVDRRAAIYAGAGSGRESRSPYPVPPDAWYGARRGGAGTGRGRNRGRRWAVDYLPPEKHGGRGIDKGGLE